MANIKVAYDAIKTVSYVFIFQIKNSEKEDLPIFIS